MTILFLISVGPLAHAYLGYPLSLALLRLFLGDRSRHEGRGVLLRAFTGRRGRVACLNQVLPGVRSDRVVMSDANSMYAPDSLRKLARHFADSRVGCVCGQLRHTNPRGYLSIANEDGRFQ